MKDEILNKLYSTDETPIPRYQVVDRDGNVLLSGVEIRLLNLISQPGTPYNKESVLPNSVAQLICPDVEDPTPADALRSLQAGKAPAGYGYGEIPVSLGSADDDTAFLTKLNEQFALTSAKTRQVRFTMVSSAWTGTLWSAGNGYGSLVANTYGVKNAGWMFTRITRLCLDGVWQPWEYENPPLMAGVEYRTTERYGGKPVYIKRINYGALAAASTTVTIPLGSLGAESIVDYALVTKNASGNVFKHPAHTLYEGKLMCSSYLSPSSNVFYIYTHTDMSGSTAVLTVKYTKA